MQMDFDGDMIFIDIKLTRCFYLYFIMGPQGFKSPPDSEARYYVPRIMDEVEMLIFVVWRKADKYCLKNSGRRMPSGHTKTLMRLMMIFLLRKYCLCLIWMILICFSKYMKRDF